jgi:hypothetical protein
MTIKDLALIANLHPAFTPVGGYYSQSGAWSSVPDKTDDLMSNQFWRISAFLQARERDVSLAIGEIGAYECSYKARKAQAAHLGAGAKEDHMSADYSGTVPKRGDRVGLTEQSVLFEVVDVNTLMQTVNLKSTDGKEHVTRNIPWTSLKFQGAASR